MTEELREYTIKERLEAYRQCLFDLENFDEQKLTLIKRIRNLQSHNFTAEKVTSSNRKHMSEEERYVLILQDINRKIHEYEGSLLAGKEDLEKYIGRLKKQEYRQLIRYYYFYRFDWWQVAEVLFLTEPNLYVEDVKLQNQSIINPNKMRLLYEWRVKALNELEELYTMPYIPMEKQLTLIKGEN